MIADLAAVGLGGVEVDHPDHAPDDRELLRELAAAHDLVTTGSSDYHGTNKTTPVARRAHRPRRVRRAASRGRRGSTCWSDDPATVGSMTGAQLGLDFEAPRLVRVTPARLGTWDDCPRRYRLTYLDRPAPVRSGGAGGEHVGRGRAPGAAVALRAAARAAHPGGGGPAGGPALEQRGLPRRRAGPPLPRTRPRLAGRVRRGRGRGRRRRAGAVGVGGGRRDRRGGPGRPRSTGGATSWWSSTTRPGARPTAEDARESRALALYALGVERTLRRRCVEVELHHLPSGHVAGWRHDRASLAAHVAAAERSAAALAARPRTWRRAPTPRRASPPGPRPAAGPATSGGTARRGAPRHRRASRGRS